MSDESGNLVEFVGTVIDITESKRSEEALRASEQVARGQVEALAQSLDVLATAPKPEKFIGQMLNTIGRLFERAKREFVVVRRIDGLARFAVNGRRRKIGRA